VTQQADATPHENAAQQAVSATGSLLTIIKAFDDYSKWVQRSYGVSGPQLWVLWELQANSGLPMSEVARRVYLHPSTLGGIADRLEAKHLARRVRRGDDRRVVHLEITSAGAELIARVPVPMRHRLLLALRDLPEGDLAVLSSLLGRVAGAVASGPQKTR